MKSSLRVELERSDLAHVVVLLGLVVVLPRERLRRDPQADADDSEDHGHLRLDRALEFGVGGAVVDHLVEGVGVLAEL